MVENSPNISTNSKHTSWYISSTEEFDDIIDRDGPILVDFYADWCGPCQMMAPIVDKLATEHPNKIVKVDVDSIPQLASRFGINSIPTLLVFIDGEESERLVGYQDEETLLRLISSN